MMMLPWPADCLLSNTVHVPWRMECNVRALHIITGKSEIVGKAGRVVDAFKHVVGDVKVNFERKQRHQGVTF